MNLLSFKEQLLKAGRLFSKKHACNNVHLYIFELLYC